MAKRIKESTPESGLVKVVDPLYDAPLEGDVTPQPTSTSSGPGLRKRLVRGFELILRLISWVIIFAVLGAGLYVGLPLLYQRFVVPVEQNTAQVGELQSQQKLTEQKLTELQGRLETLETGQEQTVESLNELGGRTSDLETDVAAHTQTLATLERIQSELQVQDEAATVELQREVNLMKATELLSRARLFMYQSNFGLARQDVQIAHDLLVMIRSDEPESIVDDLDAVIRRLDLVLSNLPNFPVAASDDLDIAWQILVTGLPQASSTIIPSAPAVTSTVEAPITPTPQATVVPTITP